MRLSLYLTAALLATLSSTIATSSSVRDANAFSVPASYHLRTKVIDARYTSGSKKDGLYVEPYHIGAGDSIAGLSSIPPESWYTYLEDDQQYFTYNGSLSPWPFQITYGSYQKWVSISISIAATKIGYQGFYFNETGLQLNNTNNGWLACDWWYSQPELFLLETGYPDETYPSTCSKVELQPVAVKS